MNANNVIHKLCIMLHDILRECCPSPALKLHIIPASLTTSLSMQIYRIYTRESMTFYTFTWSSLKYVTSAKASQLQSPWAIGISRKNRA